MPIWRHQQGPPTAVQKHQCLLRGILLGCMPGSSDSEAQQAWHTLPLTTLEFAASFCFDSAAMQRLQLGCKPWKHASIEEVL